MSVPPCEGVYRALWGLTGQSIPESWSAPWAGRIEVSLAGIGELAVYRWRKQDSGMGVVGLCRLRQIKEVNIKLKPPTVDLSSD